MGCRRRNDGRGVGRSSSVLHGLPHVPAQMHIYKKAKRAFTTKLFTKKDRKQGNMPWEQKTS